KSSRSRDRARNPTTSSVLASAAVRDRSAANSPVRSSAARPSLLAGEFGGIDPDEQLPAAEEGAPSGEGHSPLEEPRAAPRGERLAASVLQRDPAVRFADEHLLPAERHLEGERHAGRRSDVALARDLVAVRRIEPEDLLRARDDAQPLLV